MLKLCLLGTRIIVVSICCLILGEFTGRYVQAQSMGVELQNMLMPASGGMAGTSISAPQDVISAIALNPASLTQYRGTHFAFSGGWIEPTYNIGNTGGVLPNIGNYQAKSSTPGSALGNIGVSQDFSALGMPMTAGVGLLGTAGAGLNVASVPESNGTSNSIAILQIGGAFGVDLTDRLSAGAAFGVVSSSFTGLFVGSSNPALDYGVRGNVGLNYNVNEWTRIGGYYQTESSLTFHDAMILQPAGGGPLPPNLIPLDVPIDLPQNIGLGLSNESLMNGRLLLAVDLTYKLWNEATLFEAIYDNQFVVQLGAQYTDNRYKLRMGYAWNENPLQENVGVTIGGITPPGGVAAMEYIQAQFATINQHKLTGGMEITDVLPGVDMNVFLGGMFKDSQQFGASSASLESYWVGSGLSWRFRRGSGRCDIAPDEWCASP